MCLEQGQLRSDGVLLLTLQRLFQLVVLVRLQERVLFFAKMQHGNVPRLHCHTEDLLDSVRQEPAHGAFS